MRVDTGRPGGPGSLIPPGTPQLVKVPLEVAVIHQDMQELIGAARDLVQVMKEVNNALVALVGARKDLDDGIGGTA